MAYEYKSGVYELKTKCKKMAQTTQDNLKKISMTKQD